MFQNDPDLQYVRPSQIIERHPAVELLRADILRHATGVSYTAAWFQKTFQENPDNDELLNRICADFATSTLSLCHAFNLYRDTRDVQGMG